MWIMSKDLRKESRNWLHLNEVLRKEVDAQITITKKTEESFRALSLNLNW